MHHRLSVGDQRRLYRGGQLWPRRHYLPHRRALHRTVECSEYDGAGRREHRISIGWPGHGFRVAGHESARSPCHVEKQSEVGRRCVGGRWTERTQRGSFHRRNPTCGSSDLLACAWLVCGDFAGGFDSTARQWREREPVREETGCRGYYFQGRGSGAAAGAKNDRVFEQKDPQEPVGPQFAEVANRRDEEGAFPKPGKRLFFWLFFASG